jgi:hypothetical protein
LTSSVEWLDDSTEADRRYFKRKLKPHRPTDSTRWLMALLNRILDWRAALVVVKPNRLIRWHAKGSAILALEVEAGWTTGVARRSAGVDPEETQCESYLGKERIANELQLSLRIRVSPRTVGK